MELDGNYFWGESINAPLDHSFESRPAQRDELIANC
jgi:hypothetical protein